MNDKKENILLDTNDSFIFGQMENEPLKWIYLVNPHYLEWVIKNTKVCFINLELFYQFGNPWRIKSEVLTNKQMNDYLSVLRKYGKDNFSGKGSESYTLTTEIFVKLIENKTLPMQCFERFNFQFSENTIIQNNSKLENCSLRFNSTNIERKKYLDKLFNF